jgi:hypothetical protein
MVELLCEELFASVCGNRGVDSYCFSCNLSVFLIPELLQPASRGRFYLTSLFFSTETLGNPQKPVRGAQVSGIGPHCFFSLRFDDVPFLSFLALAFVSQASYFL